MRVQPVLLIYSHGSCAFVYRAVARGPGLLAPTIQGTRGELPPAPRLRRVHRGANKNPDVEPGLKLIAIETEVSASRTGSSCGHPCGRTSCVPSCGRRG